jgi:hypothetical protein
MNPERRRSPRKKAALQAELLLQGRTIPTRVSTTDLSLNGCYIENMYTLPIGARLNIGLWIQEEKLKISGMVKTCDPVFGNGIQFLEMSEQDRDQLEKYLDALNED